MREVHLHVPVPGQILPLPVPPVQVPGVEDGLSLRRHQEGHPFVGRGKRLHGDARKGLRRLTAGQNPAPGGGFLPQTPAVPVPLRQADALSQQEAGVVPVQGENAGVKVVRVAVTGKDRQRLSLRHGRQVAFPPIKQQVYALQLHQKAAVGQECDPGHRYFTAVP